MLLYLTDPASLSASDLHFIYLSLEETVEYSADEWSHLSQRESRLLHLDLFAELLLQTPPEIEIKRFNKCWQLCQHNENTNQTRGNPRSGY